MRELQIIWAALVGGVVMYTVVIYSLVTFGGIDVNVLDPGIMNFIGGAVIVWMLLALWARGLMLARIPSDLPAEGRMQRYRNTVIVSLALMEAGGLAVISMGMISGATTWILAGGGASVATMVMARPSASEVGGS